MATWGLKGTGEKSSTGFDILFGIVLAAGITGLFIFDISEPRGEVDGVGYAALVALCVRFGERTLVASAVLTTVLTIAAAFLLPDAGISVAGMWANRIFALISIWIVAAILLQRLSLEAEIAARENKLQANHAALGQIVRDGLLADKSQEERIRCIVELSAEALQADLCGVLGHERKDVIRAIDIWDRQGEKHFIIPDFSTNLSPDFRKLMKSEFAVATNDILTSPLYQAHVEFLKPFGVRAILIADTFAQEPGLGSIAFAFRRSHDWTTQEIAFARAVANLVALVLAASRNAETLSTLDQVSEAIYVEDKTGSVQYANRAAKELTKSPQAEKAGRLPRPAARLTGVSDMNEIVHEGRTLEIQRVRLPNGGVLTRINDVTARIADLSVRRQLEARIQQSAKMEAIGQLAGGVAHDFNNILGSILGFAGFLAQDLPELSTERGFAERILSACERGKGLVEQILAFARARTVEHGVVDLGLLLKRNKEFLSGLLPKKISLGMSLPDDAMPVFGSAVQIGQLITNLCMNARDAFGDEAGAIHIEARRATREEIGDLKTRPESETERMFGNLQTGRSYSLLRVEDSGTGIAGDILDRIFEPFFTTKGRHRGTGLGLAVVHGVVESTGGACHVRSSPGVGTVFSIYFPLASEVEPSAGLSVSAGTEMRGSERILIVDDERDIADMLAIGLERLGYDTVGVNDPLEALAAFTENPQAFDVVITDQVMPGMRGLELIRRMKEIRPGIKAVLCTGYSDGANAEVSRQAGADAYFPKPVDARQIAPKIRALVEGRNGG